jgi:hypothetical protein|tara:strand:+ start:442 stop:564 length:123 start_codon:yes stop_codon:yes gene_type:complete
MTIGEILIGSCLALSLFTIGVITYLLALLARAGKDIGLFE